MYYLYVYIVLCFSPRAPLLLPPRAPISPRVPLSSFGVPLGSFWVPLGCPWAPLGCPWAPFGCPRAPLGCPWAPLGCPWALLGALGLLWDVLRLLWAALGLLWGALGLLLGCPWTPFGFLGTSLGGPSVFFRIWTPLSEEMLLKYRAGRQNQASRYSSPASRGKPRQAAAIPLSPQSGARAAAPNPTSRAGG